MNRPITKAEVEKIPLGGFLRPKYPNRAARRGAMRNLAKRTPEHTNNRKSGHMRKTANGFKKVLSKLVIPQFVKTGRVIFTKPRQIKTKSMN